MKYAWLNVDIFYFSLSLYTYYKDNISILSVSLIWKNEDKIIHDSVKYYLYYIAIKNYKCNVIYLNSF